MIVMQREREKEREDKSGNIVLVREECRVRPKQGRVGEREGERERDGGWRELAFWVECGQPLIKSAGQIRQDSRPDWTPGSRALARLTRGVDGQREGARWRRRRRKEKVKESGALRNI